MVLRSRFALVAVALAVGCGSRRAAVPGGDGGSRRDAAPDAGVDAAPDLDAGDAALDRGDSGRDGGGAADSGPRDASPDADPNVYPCEEDSDCNRWWRGFADCLNGFCCLGEDVDGTCMCGDRVGTCPPGFLACCPTFASEGELVCTGWAMCDFGPG